MKLKNQVNSGIYGKEPLFDVREISTLRDVLDSSTEIYAKRTAFLQKFDAKAPYTEITYAKFREDVYCLGESLIDMDLKGKKIALIGENRYEWAVSYMSIVCGVGTVVPIDKELSYDEIEKLLDFAEVSAVVCTQGIIRKNPEISNKNVKLINIDTDLEGLIKKGRELINSGRGEFAAAEVNPNDEDILLFTSGTSGTPKGVILSHKNICSNLINICSVFKIDENDRVFSVLPLHHTYECTCGFLCEIYVGASIAYCQGLKYILKNLQESQPTMFFMVPMILESLYKVLNRTIDKNGQRAKVNMALKISRMLRKVGIDLRRKFFAEIIDRFGGKINMFLVGAAPVEPKMLEFFTDIGITSIQGYGMTECAPIITENRASHFRNDSVGMPVPELELKIAEADKDGIGEIVVRGDNVMKGYYKNPEETAKVLENGWLRTGDMGYMKDGFLYLTGRKKNLIITSNGENVFPEELETVLCKSEYISECMVYQDNNVITAQIYPEYSYFEDNFSKDMSDKDIENILDAEIKKINKTLPPYKAIARYIIRKEEFIKTTTKKIKRSDNI